MGHAGYDQISCMPHFICFSNLRGLSIRNRLEAIIMKLQLKDIKRYRIYYSKDLKAKDYVILCSQIWQNHGLRSKGL